MIKEIQLADIPAPQTSLQEYKLLTALCDNPVYIKDAMKFLDRKSFTTPEAQKVWDTLTDMYCKGEDISVVDVMNLCDTNFFLNHILPFSVGALPYEEIFKTLREMVSAAQRRSAYTIGVKMAHMASTSGDIEECRALMTRYLEVEDEIGSRSTKRISEVMVELGDTLEENEALRKAGKTVKVPTSIDDLNWITYGGFTRGNLVIMAARPSVGKTAVMLQMAREASSANIPSLIVSLEMTGTELAQRLVLSTGNLTQRDLLNSTVNWDSFNEATKKFDNHPLWIDDTSCTMDEIELNVTQAHRRGQCEVVYIDYLGLISSKDDRRTLYQQVTDNTRRLKLLAKKLNIPVVCLCQLNRDSAKDNRVPEMHDLRESGSIEQDADIILLLHKPFKEGSTEPIDGLHMYIAKNRQGRRGKPIILEANDTYTVFTEPVQYDS